MRGLRKGLGLGVAVALILGATPLQAQRGIVRGQVTDAAGQPLADVLMSLLGTNVTVRSAADGTYELRAVTPGTATIRAALIGYGAQTLTVDVTAAVMAELNFALTEAAISLDAMVVTATGAQRAVEVPNVVTTIDAAQAASEVAPPSIATLIQGRAPGVQIINSGGTAGTATLIRIRGSSSMNLSNEPLLVMDGIRVDNRSNDIFGDGDYSDGAPVYVGGQSISRINDLNPDEIESIEIVKGPSAAALYGTEAANGVIVVKTKRGRAGAPVWNVYGEYGLKSDITDWPNNYSGLDAAGDWCPTFAAAEGACDIASIQYANPLESRRTTPITTSPRYQFGVNVSGGTSYVQYFLSGEYERENGIYTLPAETQDSILSARPEGYEIPEFALNPNRVTRTSLRGNLNAQLGESVNLLLSTGYVDGKIRLPQNDNNVQGMLPSGLFGYSDSTVVGGWGFFTPEEIFWIETDQRVQRFTQSLNATWNATRWLEFRGIAGIDYSTIGDVQFQAIGTGPDYSSYKTDGRRWSSKSSTWQQTLDFGSTARFRLSDRVTSRTSVGVQYFRNYREAVWTYGQKLPPGVGSNGSATDQYIGEYFIESRTLGTFIEQQFGIDDRLYVTAAVRGDDNSAFGADFDYTVYPKVGASYLLLSRRGGILDDVRLRGAWGASGVAPGTNDASRFYTGAPFVDKGSEQTGAVIQGAGNVDLKPERSTEWEGGMEVGLFGGRLGLDATVYYRRTSDALVNRELAPSLGLTANRFENIAKTKNYGIEGGINGTPVRTSFLTWDFSLSGSTNTNEVVELGEGIEPIIFNGGTQAHKEGYPLGAYHALTYTFDDANGDGLIGVGEVTVSDSAEFLGYSRPRYDVSLFNAFNVGGWLRISGLFDYRGGHKLYNYTEEFRCRMDVCRPLNDPAVPLDEQARAIAGALTDPAADAGYIEPAWFIKLRELSFTFYAPAGFARMLGSSQASLTITGRNLLKITDYSGLDPEIQENAFNFSSNEFLGQPPVRYWTARVQLTF